MTFVVACHRLVALVSPALPLSCYDGVVDALLNCDGGFSPGSGDVAHVNAGDPGPAGCETVGP
jgi:hypothetical protein